MSRRRAPSPRERARWRRIQELFHRAADLAPHERRALLDTECAGDADLRREVESLLESDVEAETVLTRVVATTLAGFLRELYSDPNAPGDEPESGPMGKKKD